MPQQLSEDRRKQLDSIVQQMTDNGEPDDAIRFVVDDFKSKYGTEPSKPGMLQTGVQKVKDYAPAAGVAGTVAAGVPLALAAIRHGARFAADNGALTRIAGPAVTTGIGAGIGAITGHGPTGAVIGGLVGHAGKSLATPEAANSLATYFKEYAPRGTFPKVPLEAGRATRYWKDVPYLGGKLRDVLNAGADTGEAIAGVARHPVRAITGAVSRIPGGSAAMRVAGPLMTPLGALSASADVNNRLNSPEARAEIERTFGKGDPNNWANQAREAVMNEPLVRGTIDSVTENSKAAYDAIKRFLGF